MRQVVQHAGELAFTADPHFPDRQLHRKQRAVAAATGHLAADADDLGLAGLEIALEVPVMLLMLWRRHQQADIAPDDLRFGIAEQLLSTAVERLDDSLGTDDDDAVGRGVENRIEPFGAGIRRRRDLCVGPPPPRAAGE